MRADHSAMSLPVTLQCHGCKMLGAYGPFGEDESCIWCGVRKHRFDRGPTILAGGVPGVVHETVTDEFGPGTNMAKIVEQIPAMNASHRKLVLAEKEEYAKLFEQGEGPINLMSVEYDHQKQDYVWSANTCPWLSWDKEVENGMIEGLKEKDVRKINKFKLRIDGPYVYVLEYWEEEERATVATGDGSSSP